MCYWPLVLTGDSYKVAYVGGSAIAFKIVIVNHGCQPDGSRVT